MFNRTVLTVCNIGANKGLRSLNSAASMAYNMVVIIMMMIFPKPPALFLSPGKYNMVMMIIIIFPKPPSLFLSPGKYPPESVMQEA